MNIGRHPIPVPDKCDETSSRVIALAIFGSNFSGQIPPVVGNLKYLESLVFRKLPNLTGKSPFAITKLIHLKEIRLSWTNLSGLVPSFFALLKNLTFLDLAFNNLTGSIPPEATNQSSKLCRTFSSAEPIVFSKLF
ncbi:Polygalacturonase inhibitor [Camellia lanceoleosa]|uniref:Polygalacturonase inhibitor n=1 Tax=Camellia lanceoleosa TaxID=1840588 RepID=A0ACC0H8Z9_9ERIC|nr:Polygalacturonase inhibitor [Camellia lanceoleosa]